MKCFLGKDLLCHSVTSWQFQEPRDCTLEWKSGHIFDALRFFSFQCIHPKGPHCFPEWLSRSIPCEYSSAPAVTEEMTEHNPAGSSQSQCQHGSWDIWDRNGDDGKEQNSPFYLDHLLLCSQWTFFSHLPCAVDKAPCIVTILPSFKKCLLLCTIYRNVVVKMLALQVYTDPPPEKWQHWLKIRLNILLGPFWSPSVFSGFRESAFLNCSQYPLQLDAFFNWKIKFSFSQTSMTPGIGIVIESPKYF